MKHSWRDLLKAALNQAPKTANPLRVALVGVGNELNGDDAAGVEVVRRVTAQRPPPPWLLLLEAGLAPENFGGPLRRFAPDLVVVVDAAWLDEPPGSVAWLDWQEADGLSASTHSLPLSMLGAYLVHELGCRVALLGIQPAQLEFGQPLSPAVDVAVEMVVTVCLDAVGR